MKKYSSIILSILCILILAGCSKKEQIVPDTPNAMVPSIIYQGSLYRTTGKQIPAEVDESAIVGEISSVVPLNQLPTKEGEANFGKIGDQYAITSDGLLVKMNNEWTLFELSDIEVEETITYNGKEYKKSELCDATLHWLELSEQEKMLSSYMPPEFMIFEETWGLH